MMYRNCLLHNSTPNLIRITSFILFFSIVASFLVLYQEGNNWNYNFSSYDDEEDFIIINDSSMTEDDGGSSSTEVNSNGKPSTNVVDVMYAPVQGGDISPLGDKSSQNTHNIISNLASESIGNSVEEKVKFLEDLNIPFYMYDHPNITFKGQHINLNGNKLRRFGYEMLYDKATIRVLEESPMRTKDSENAKLYIIPTPMSEISASKMQDLVHLAFGTLLNTTTFKRTNGHNHVLVATSFILFRGDKAKSDWGTMKDWYPKLWNITVALSWDPSEIANGLKNGVEFYEYTDTFKTMKPMTKRVFSLGLTGGTNFPITKKEFSNPNGLDLYCFPLTLASLEKFHSSSNLIFYHSPTFGSIHNSTIHRQAPITNITLENFPKSSIGFGISSRNEWIQTFRDSKFCLNIRGDSPHSHALFRSIRSGCIPVISSNTLPIFSPILKATLNMSDYCIILDENELVNDPHNVLIKLNALDESFIKNKIQHLILAQRVMFHDHPESLFEKAFLYEALHPSEVDDSMNPY